MGLTICNVQIWMLPTYRGRHHVSFVRINWPYYLSGALKPCIKQGNKHSKKCMETQERLQLYKSPFAIKDVCETAAIHLNALVFWFFFAYRPAAWKISHLCLLEYVLMPGLFCAFQTPNLSLGICILVQIGVLNMKRLYKSHSNYTCLSLSVCGCAKCTLKLCMIMYNYALCSWVMEQKVWPYN